MINHAFCSLYGYATPSAAGIYVPLTAPVKYGDVLTSGLQGVRGRTSLTAETFAIHALKVLDGSTYASEVYRRDPRVTYRLDELGVNAVDSAEFLEALTELPGAAQSLLLGYPDTSKTFSTSKILPERAAAVLAGLLRQVNELNAY